MQRSQKEGILEQGRVFPSFKEVLRRERTHKHEIELSEEQRFVLQQLISSGKAPARQLAPARILLKIDRNAPGPRWTDEQVAEAFAHEPLEGDPCPRTLREQWVR